MTGIIVSVIDWLTSVVNAIIPDLSVSDSFLSNVADALELVIDFVAKVNFLIPIPTILLVMSIVYTFKYSKFIVFCVNWVIRRIADLIP